MHKLHKPIYRPYGRDSKIQAHASWLALEAAAVGIVAAWESYKIRMLTGCWHESGTKKVGGTVHKETWGCTGSLFNSVCVTGSTSTLKKNPC